MDDDAADVLTIHKILGALVNFVQCGTVFLSASGIGSWLPPGSQRVAGALMTS